MLVEFDNLLCLSDIARLLGVSRQRIDQLKRKLPKPVGKKGSAVLWLKQDIMSWDGKGKRTYKQAYFPSEYKPFTKQTEILTPREMSILIKYVNNEDTSELGIEKSTFAHFIQKIKKKLGICSVKEEITQKALELGLISEKISVNKIRCNFCGDIIESTHVHDFKTCKCGRVSVDGGHEYLRRCFKEVGDYEELSISNYGEEKC